MSHKQIVQEQQTECPTEHGHNRSSVQFTHLCTKCASVCSSDSLLPTITNKYEHGITQTQIQSLVQLFPSQQEALFV